MGANNYFSWVDLRVLVILGRKSEVDSICMQSTRCKGLGLCHYLRFFVLCISVLLLFCFHYTLWSITTLAVVFLFFGFQSVCVWVWFCLLIVWSRIWWPGCVLCTPKEIMLFLESSFLPLVWTDLTAVGKPCPAQLCLYPFDGKGVNLDSNYCFMCPWNFYWCNSKSTYSSKK